MSKSSEYQLMLIFYFVVASDTRQLDANLPVNKHHQRALLK
ncbi:hypothetical protein CKA32_001648 [Geitlerinema sp. FC II]|nr:hypothetical protein CKA32_001648 [Geitlerinema sp. FC II]